MRQRSFTSSSSPTISFLFLLTVMILIFDRVVFSLLFPLYDNWFRVESSLSASDILVVGSSHIESDIDIKLLSSLTKKKVGLFSLPGAGIVPRYYAIKERLELNEIPIPKIIILETSVLVFHKSRYFDDESVQLIPYYHRGRFLEYINEYGPRNSDWIWRKIFWSYSLNSAFSRITDPLNVSRYFAEKFLSPEKYLELRDKFKSKEVLCTGSDDPRIAIWSETNEKMNLNNIVDEKKLEYFNKILKLVGRYPIKLILMNPPFFHFKNESSGTYLNVESILKSAQRENIKYLDLKIENDSCLFTDSGHLGRVGQEQFTSELVDSIQAWN